MFFLALIINGPCFGIPQTYLAHIKTASEFRGHLAGLRESWQSYTRQLVREYSDFILVVSPRSFGEATPSNHSDSPLYYSRMP